MPGFEIVEDSDRDLSRFKTLPKESTEDKSQNKDHLNNKEIDMVNTIVKQGASIVNKSLDIAVKRAEGKNALDKAEAKKIELEADSKNFREKQEVLMEREEKMGNRVQKQLETVLDKVETLNGQEAGDILDKTLESLKINETLKTE